MTKTAFLFPGQGAQFIGMGKELADAFPSAQAVFQEVDDALGEGLSSLMWSGSEDNLKLTQNTQPALMAVSLAAARALEAEFDMPVAKVADYVAGHSLGEYSALASVGVVGIADAARLLRYRGQAMQKAVPAGEGAMAALLGADADQAAAACKAGNGVCEIANDNAPGQIVISGEKDAVERAASWARENGIKKAVMLPVSAPFHCSLMQPAADAMRDALDGVEFSAPAVPVFTNVTAAEETDPNTLKALLVQQVTGTVRWRESVEAMHTAGVTQTAECGAGKVLSVMNRRTAKSIKGVALGTPDDLEAFANERSGDA